MLKWISRITERRVRTCPAQLRKRSCTVPYCSMTKRRYARVRNFRASPMISEKKHVCRIRDGERGRKRMLAFSTERITRKKSRAVRFREICQTGTRNIDFNIYRGESWDPSARYRRHIPSLDLHTGKGKSCYLLSHAGSVPSANFFFFHSDITDSPAYFVTLINCSQHRFAIESNYRTQKAFSILPRNGAL